MEGAYRCGLKMKMEVKMAPGAPFSLFFCLMEKACNNKSCVPIAFPTSAKPGFLYAAMDATSYAAFVKESRKKRAGATKLHRKSGEARDERRGHLRCAKALLPRMKAGAYTFPRVNAGDPIFPRVNAGASTSRT